jgi:beta-N-acetylhexosaminidase
MCEGGPVLRRLALLLVPALLVAGCTGPQGKPVSPSSPGSSAQNATPDFAALAAAAAARMSDVDLVGQVLMPSINMSDASTTSAALVTKYHLGGLILMGNVENTAASGSADQVRHLTDALRTAAKAYVDADPLLATDQEYGWVTRIKSGIVQLPSAMAFGAAGRPDLTEPAWHGAGSELAAAGINVDFAPDADVLGSAGNVIIGSRSFGSDAAAVSGQVAAAVKGLQSAGVAATIKHFPGHGHTTVNSHDALPVLSQSMSELARNDLPPFQAGIDAGTWLVMAGHLDVRAIDPGLPATFSHKVLVDLLRGQMGFQGVVVADALNMEPAKRWPPSEAPLRALLAGVDLLLMPPDLAAGQRGLLDALKNGRLPRERLVEAATRVLTLRYRLTALTRKSTVDIAGNRQASLRVAAGAVTVLRGPCTGALVSGSVRVTAAPGRDQPAAWLTAALKAQGVNVVSSGGQVVHLVGYGDTSGELSSAATVTVAMDSPFVLGAATSAVRVATYSSTQVAMEALAAVIAGKAKAAGRSPVAVSGLPASACSS